MSSDTLPDWERVLSAAARLQQLQVQLANPMPFDPGSMQLAEYQYLDSHWHDWATVKAACIDTALMLFDRIIKPPRP